MCIESDGRPPATYVREPSHSIDRETPSPRLSRHFPARDGVTDHVGWTLLTSGTLGNSRLHSVNE
jgi:hypothetical protein